MVASSPEGIHPIHPSPQGPPPPSEGWWTPRRAALYRWLEGNAPGLAPVYEAAARMAFDETFPGRVCLVAHAVREIRNRLPDALGGEVKAARTDYVDLAGNVQARWIEDGLPADGTRPIDVSSEPSTSHPGRCDVSAELLNAVADLVAGHLAASENNEAKARRLFEAVGGSPPPNYVVKTWLGGTRWAPRSRMFGTSHFPGRTKRDWRGTSSPSKRL